MDSKPINVALLGSGGREHAIAWKLSQSPRLATLFALPGNPGIARLGRCRKVNITDPAAVVKFCQSNDIGFVIIGAEDPLAAGVADAVIGAGIPCFGPKANAAQLEADKAFAKELMRQGSIPTADARTFTDINAAEQYVRRKACPLVVKAAGLAKGKGVSVCDTEAEALKAVNASLRLWAFGAAGRTIVIEDKLEGVECSVLALVDDHDLFVLPPCQDHKPVGEGNTGPMTGGMGAFCPTQTIGDELMRQVESEIFVPTLDALAREGINFRGCLYAGLMLTSDGPKVLEFNTRFGDPETQPLMMRWKGDVLEALLSVAQGRLAEFVESGGIDFDPRAAVGVVCASEGYPGEYRTGDAIEGIDAADALADVQVFQAGVAMRGEDLVTDGGRVLCVTALGDDLAAARERAYEGVSKLHFNGMHFRRDIGHGA